MSDNNRPYPEGTHVSDEHLDYLDNLRESGITNMFGAGEYVQQAFGVNRQDAKEIVLYWMRTFSERQPQKGS